MRVHHDIRNRFDLPLVLIIVFLGVLWLAGGASQAQMPAQPIARAGAWVLLVSAILLGERPNFRTLRAVAALLLAALALPLLQLIPLPPALWQALPGRGLFAQAMPIQPWRPWTTVPGGTENAAASLIFPATMLVLLASLTSAGRAWLPGLLLGLICASTLLGLLQFSGAAVDNPLINDEPGQVSGSFANRNHFALFLAMGCLIAPAWAFLDGRRPKWRGPVALALLLLFVLTILASGSRAGVLIGALALGFSLFLTWRPIRHEMRSTPRWLFFLLIAAIVGVLILFVLISVAANRAEAISRVFVTDIGQDMRSRSLPTLIEMVRTYFPAGTGFGGFDPMFRIHEPFDLLKITYFNHAHNDFLEVVLEGGLPGLLLLLSATGWWIFASVRVFQGGGDPRYLTAKVGSAMVLLVFIASLFDYPARTPIIMAMVVIAAAWLSQGVAAVTGSPLPSEGQQL